MSNVHRQLPLIVFISLLLLAACSPATQATPVQPPASLSPAVETSSSLTPDPSAAPEHTTTPIQAAPTSAQPSTTPSPTSSVQDCSPTMSDMLGPFYVPGAPLRDKVGEGYLLTGVVRSATDCRPIPEAQIEIWMAGPDGEYADEYRATLYSDDNGAYSFESHFPPPYSGRPPHHHLQVSAPGYQTLVTQHYPQPGESQATFDLVLLPAQ